MGNYPLDPRSTFLNRLFLGPEVGNQFISPELRQILGTYKTRDAVRELGHIQLTSLFGQKKSIELQREGNSQLGELNTNLGRVGDDLSDGLAGLSGSVAHGFVGLKEGMSAGFGVVSSQLGHLSDGVQKGFEQTEDALHELGTLQLVSLAGQRQSISIQRETNVQIAKLNEGVHHVGESVIAGMDKLSQGVSRGLSGISQGMDLGFGNVRFRLSQLAGGMQQGFEEVVLGLLTGFQAVVKGLYHVDERLGKQLFAGFSSLGQQLDRQHEHAINTLVAGFDFMADAIDRNSSEMVEAIESAANGQNSATYRAADQITEAVLLSSQLQTAAIVAMHREVVERLDYVNFNLRHQAANEAHEHFMDGMNFMNHGDFVRARERFGQARATRVGHVPTLFADGFCCRVLGDAKSAQDSFEAALSQTDEDADRANRQHSLAAFYLGRLAFDRGEYNQSRRWFHLAYSKNKRLWVALVEGAASQLLDTAGAEHRATDSVEMKKELNATAGPDAYLYWYWLALTIVEIAPEFAVDAFRHGFHGHSSLIGKDRVPLIAILWRLNPRTAGRLLDLLRGEFPWL